MLLVSRQGAIPGSAPLSLFSDAARARPLAGKVRLAKWYQTLSAKSKSKIVKDVTQLVLARRTRMCNFLEYKVPESRKP